MAIGLRSLIGIEAINGGGFASVRVVGTSAGETFDFSSVAITGIAAIEAGSGNDIVIGSAANDIIDGQRGDDQLSGGVGNDVFRVSSSAGTDNFNGDDGLDTILAAANNVVISMSSFSLAENEVEATSSGGFAGVRISGTSAANLLDFSGVDLSGITSIDGGSGSDTIIGLSGADRIVCSSSAYVLTGGRGIFYFISASDSRGTTRDLITDFTPDEDKIELATMDANTLSSSNQAFTFITTNSMEQHAKLLVYNIAGLTVIAGDTNGNRVADFEIHLNGLLPLSDTDFLL